MDQKDAVLDETIIWEYTMRQRYGKRAIKTVGGLRSAYSLPERDFLCVERADMVFD